MKKIIYILIFILGTLKAFSNGIGLSNLSTTYNSGTNKLTVNFDISWENSWRNAVTKNWDAAWVFFKFNNGGEWMHLDLTGLDVTLPTGFTYYIPSDKKGIMIYRDTFGSGNVNLTGCKVGANPRWGDFDIKAFALEMVYIPKDSFYLGDGYSGSANKFSNGNSAPFNPFKVTTNTTTFGGSTGQLYDSYFGSTGTSNSLFPNGYDSFYVMKYELSIGGFRDFFNCLTLNQQNILSWSTSIFNPAGSPYFSGIQRSGITPLEIDVPGSNPNNTPAVLGCDMDNDNIRNEPNDGENLACGGISFGIWITYMDWAGLRPFTDLEYEKMSRGPLNPLQGEYAWGSNSVQASNNYSFVGLNTDSERVSNSVTAGMANFSPYVYFCPVRCGMYANSSSNRSASGGSYYGVMELSGNLFELTAVGQSPSMNSFRANHGDGRIHVQGGHNVDFWPGTSGTFFNSGAGHTSSLGSYIGLRGGSYETSALPISYRNITYQNLTISYWSQGLRGARSVN